MSLKGKTIRSKASGLVGQIVGVEKGELRVTFTRFQEISIPLAKAENLLEMDEETLEELHKEIASSAKDKVRSILLSFAKAMILLKAPSNSRMLDLMLVAIYLMISSSISLS